jgi:lipopolysaccharide/colanic/teichoic acid biosynthesis glycosyltransferase/carbonic anhydrase/acetyltransferase-like protein (isoleucine patch superfamily)
VLRYLGERLASAGHPRLTIATDFEPGPDYERRVGDSGARVDAIVSARDLAGRIADYEPSDWLVIVDPRCTPSVGLDRRALVLESDGGPRRVRHLVALEAHPGGTTERVQLGANGTVDRIQRFYDSATWPFTSGVACSVLPVSCTLWAGDLPFTCLRDLRRSLAERGVPSHDVFIRGGAFDLTREGDLLGLSERVVLDHFRGRRAVGNAWVEVGPGCRIDASARLLGPVVLQERVEIGPDATVVGPAVIGAGARLERAAVVAQCVVGPDSVVASGLTLRHRAVFGTVSEAGRAATPAAVHDPDPPPAEPSDVEDDAPRSPATLGLKAAFDVTAAALGLLLLSPLLLLVALLVKLESKGPVFHRDRREGLGGRVFECLKFRTMFAGADAQQRELLAKNEVDGPQFKLARDPRVTRLGRVLRKLNVDELPQLVNVLLLEMSLVGPRPSPFRENQLCIPWREARLSVRPGITGLWQICRNRRLQGDFHQWIHFDLLYVEHASFLVDLKILAATVLTLAGQWPAPLSWIIPSRDLAPTSAGGLASTQVPNLSRSEGLI